MVDHAAQNRTRFMCDHWPVNGRPQNANRPDLHHKTAKASLSMHERSSRSTESAIMRMGSPKDHHRKPIKRPQISEELNY
eukprot:scaffold1353_cov161-Amphora_coffeaeformis.AAC.19